MNPHVETHLEARTGYLTDTPCSANSLRTTRHYITLSVYGGSHPMGKAAPHRKDKVDCSLLENPEEDRRWDDISEGTAASAHHGTKFSPGAA